MIKVFACFLLGCVVLTFGARRERIGYGRDVTELEFKKEFPFMVYVDICVWFLGPCNFCSGTLVKPDVVIVAAHCFCNMGPIPTTTVYSSSLKDGSSKATATAGERLSGMPDSYCGNDMYPHVGRDIALIGLMQNLDVPTVRLFCDRNGWWTVVFLVNGKRMVVKFPHIPVPVGTKVWMVGYGYNQKKQGFGRLRVATAKIVKCPQPRYKGQSVFCVASPPGEPTILSGDSGGPLLIKRGGKFFQIGVTSMGKKFDQIRYRRFAYNVFVKVSIYCKTIKSARI